MLTENQAIKECKELWTQIYESGLSKEKFMETPQGMMWREREYFCNCPLCEFTKNSDCVHGCPLHKQLNTDCCDLDFCDQYHSYNAPDPTPFYLEVMKLKEVE